ncbi:MAG: protein kinase [Planctomycetaceae bacterium]
MSSDQGFNSFFSDSFDGPIPQIDRYEFRGKLGEGKFGEVWLAWDQRLERLVAIKLAHRVYLPDPADTRMMIAEARSLAAMSHPNIIEVYDLGETSEGRFYVVSRFVDGCDLARILKRGMQNLAFTLEVIATVAEALDSAHKRGFVHRDIKPANILIDDATQSPYLADFGLAQRESDILNCSDLAGTPLYMSPEQVTAGGSMLDCRSDLFSLGCVLYQMLTGVHPFSGNTTSDVLSAIVNTSPVRPSSLNAEIPDELEQICLKALQKDPAERFATAGKMADALRQIMEQNKTTASTEPAIVGTYRLIKRIGEGGMGVVYEAEQMRPVRRQVALKIIKASVSSEETKRRFQTERQALSVLNHPHIASVYESGVFEDGQLYFTMELVTGSSITNYCETNQLSLNQKLELFFDVCEAIQHAHQKGIVHRDIKPSNVMIGQKENSPCVKVIDFGLAKTIQPIGRLTEKELATEFGKEMGTYEYMSPEQAGLNALDVDTRSDVYSLGVLLYELLTGSRPFERSSSDRVAIEQLLTSIRERDPERPSQRLAGNKDSPFMQMGELHRVDLDWITMKAIEKDRDRRYESAAQLADDIRRYLKQEPVTARPPSLGYLMQKAVSRHRLAIGIAVLIAVSLVLGIFGTTWQMLRARTAERKADVEKSKAIAARVETEASLARANYLLAASRWDEGRTKEAFDALYLVPTDLRQFEWYLLRHSMDAGQTTLYGHTKAVNCVEVSHDGTRVVSASEDGSVLLWDTLTLRNIGQNRVADCWINKVTFSPDGCTIAAAGTDGKIRLLDAESLEVRAEFSDGSASVNCVAFSDDGQLIASGDDKGTIRVWNTSTGEMRQTIAGHTRSVRAIAFRPNQEQFASGGEDASLKLWSLTSQEPVAELKGHAQWVTSVAFTKDGERLVSGSADRTVLLWSLNDFRQIASNSDSVDWILAVAVSPDGKQIAMSGSNQAIHLWDVETGRKRQLRGHRGDEIRSIDFSTDGSMLVSASDDATIKIWDVASEKVDGIVGEGLWEIECLSYQATGHKFVSVGSDSRIRLWDSASGKQISEIENEFARVYCAAINVTGEVIVSGHDDGTVVVWDVASNSAKVNWKGHNGAIHAISFLKDGERFVTGSDDNTIKIWEADSTKELRVLRGHSGPVRCLAVSRIRDSIASGSVDETVRCWEAGTGKSTAVFSGDLGSVHSVCFNPDETKLASGGRDGAIHLWNLKQQEPTTAKLLLGHSRQVDSVAFTNDGQRIAASGADGTVRFWDPATGVELRRYVISSAWVKQIAFNPKFDQLVIGDHEGKLRIWDAPREFEMQVLPCKDGRISTVNFGSDGLTLWARDAFDQVIGWKYADDRWTRDPDAREVPKSVDTDLGHSGDERWLAIPFKNTVTLIDKRFRAGAGKGRRKEGGSVENRAMK